MTSILDANGGTTSFGYGLENAPTSLTDPNGNTTIFQYDLQQRLASKSYPDGATQTITYEPCCSRTSSVTDALGNTKTYTYFLDNQIKNIDYSGTTPDVSFTNDTFLPRPLSMTDGQGVTSMTYGPVGAPGANQLATISGPFGDTASFTYDIAGRIVESTINGSVSSLVYDQLWRPTSITNELDTFVPTYLGTTGQVTGLTSSVGPTFEYAYDNNIGDRRLLQIKNLRNNGTGLSQFDYTYDPIGQITQISQTFGSGNDGGGGGDGDDGNCGKKCCKKKRKKCCKKKRCCKKRCCKGKAHKKRKRCCKKHKHYRKSCHKKRYKVLVWLIKQVFKNVWGWDVSDWGEEEDELGGSTGGGGGTTATTEVLDFTYDNLSQLVGVNLNQTSFASYEIDPAGNLTSVTIDGVTTALNHNNLNQTTAPGISSYDPKGQTMEQDGRTFEWDEQGRVIAIVEGTHRSEFEYDGMSKRTVITEIENGTVVSKKLYWWLSGSIVCERDALQPGFPITKRYFGQGLVDNGAKLFYTTDHLGSIRELLDDQGNVVAEYRYSIYGERTKVSGDLDSDYGFAGLFHHEPSGLDLATYRLYDSSKRRFISRDPLGEDVDYNLYRYANNNPVNFVDPDGLYPESPSSFAKAHLTHINKQIRQGKLSDAHLGATHLRQQVGPGALNNSSRSLIAVKKQMDKATKGLEKGELVGNCPQIAQRFFDLFKGAGGSPKVIKVKTDNPNAFIMRKGNNKAAVGEGQHYAVESKGRIYDAYTGLDGIPKGDYLNLFRSKSHMTKSTVNPSVLGL